MANDVDMHFGRCKETSDPSCNGLEAKETGETIDKAWSEPKYGTFSPVADIGKVVQVLEEKGEGE